MEFCSRLVISLSTLLTAQRHRIGDIVTEVMRRLREIIATLKVDITVALLDIVSISRVRQESYQLSFAFVCSTLTSTVVQTFWLCFPIKIENMMSNMI